AMVAQITVSDLKSVHGGELRDQDLGQLYPITLLIVLRISINEFVEPVVTCRKLAQFREFLSNGLHGGVSDRTQTTFCQLMIPLPQINQNIPLPGKNLEAPLWGFSIYIIKLIEVPQT